MTAILSPDLTCRYRLEREVDTHGPVLGYFGINPSTADADTDDATVRKWRGFTKTNGGSKFIVGNVFSYRATNVKELSYLEDDFGPKSDPNIVHLEDIIKECDILIPCWGNTSKVPESLRGDIDFFKNRLIKEKENKPVYCFGYTKSGDPKHPLMLSYSTELTEFY